MKIKKIIDKLFFFKKKKEELVINQPSVLRKEMYETKKAMEDEELKLQKQQQRLDDWYTAEVASFGTMNMTQEQLEEHIQSMIKESTRIEQHVLSYEEFYKDLVFKEKTIHSNIFNKTVDKDLFISDGEYRVDLQEAFLKKFYDINYAEYKASITTGRRPAIFDGSANFNSYVGQWDITKVTNLASLGTNPNNTTTSSFYDKMDLNPMNRKGKQKK